MKMLLILLLGNSFMLQYNENILFNRVAKIILFVLLTGYLTKEIENIFFRARVPTVYFSFSQTRTCLDNI